MTNYLLDTHVLIWFMNGDENLPKLVKEKVINANSSCFISIASLWEIAIKSSLGKLDLQIEFSQILQFLADNNIEVLSIEFGHLQKLLVLPYHHRDPFDRIIISQGIANKFILISKDGNFRKYNVSLIWD